MQMPSHSNYSAFKITMKSLAMTPSGVIPLYFGPEPYNFNS